MGNISSINFKKSTDFQAFHNSNMRPNYAIGGNLEVNRTGYEARALKEQIINDAKEAYTKRTGQKFQAKSYEWSAVVNLKPDSTMADLEKLTEYFQTKYGWQCYQIAIHRDEGHIDENGQKKINHHAHLEFVMLDKNGITSFKKGKFGVKKMREIQSEVAEILGMQRGIDKRLSGAKRIEPRQWAQMKELERAERKAKITELTTQHAQEMENARGHYKALKGENEALQDKNKALESRNQVLEAITKKEIAAIIEQKRKEWIAENQKLKDENQALKQGFTAEDYKALRALKEKNYKEIQELKQAIQELEQKIQEKNAENAELKKSLENAEKINENQKGRLEALKKEKMDLNTNFERLKANYESLQQKEALKGENQAQELAVTQNLNAKTIQYAQSFLQERKYEIKIIETPQFTSFKDDTKGLEALDYGLKIELKNTESANLQEKVKFMLSVAEAKGWRLKDIQANGSQEFKDEVQRQIIDSYYNRNTNLKIKLNKLQREKTNSKSKGFSR